MLKSIVQILEFFQTTCIGIRATLDCSLIPKHVVIVYTNSLYENASKTIRHSCFTLESIAHA